MDTGTPVPRSKKKNLTSIPAIEKQQLLEQVHILFVLEQRAVQRRNQLLRVVAAQRLGRYILGDQQLDPIQQLGRGRFLFQPGCLANIEERRERLAQQLALQIRKVHIDDLRHGLFVGNSMRSSSRNRSLGNSISALSISSIKRTGCTSQSKASQRSPLTM